MAKPLSSACWRAISSMAMWPGPFDHHLYISIPGPAGPVPNSISSAIQRRSVLSSAQPDEAHPPGTDGYIVFPQDIQNRIIVLVKGFS